MPVWWRIPVPIAVTDGFDVVNVRCRPRPNTRKAIPSNPKEWLNTFANVRSLRQPGDPSACVGILGFAPPGRPGFAFIEDFTAVELIDAVPAPL